MLRKKIIICQRNKSFDYVTIIVIRSIIQSIDADNKLIFLEKIRDRQKKRRKE